MENIKFTQQGFPYTLFPGDDHLKWPENGNLAEMMKSFALVRLRITRNALYTFYRGVYFGLSFALYILLKDGRLTEETAVELKASIKKAFEDDLAEKRQIAREMLVKRMEAEKVIEITGLIGEEVELMVYGNGYDPEDPLHTKGDELETADDSEK